VQRDHEAEWRQWEARLQVITDAVQGFDTVSTSVRTPQPSNVAPHLSIQWQAEALGVSAAEARQQLSAGEPRIEVSGGADSLTINPYMMAEGEDRIVAQRLAELLAG
jgi:L-seryl-tRNA(Ser) seleniumtransferase